MANQLGQIQSAVAKQRRPIRVLATGISTGVRRVLNRRKAFNWLMSFSKHPVDKVAELDNAVYLTDAAEEVLEDYDPL